MLRASLVLYRRDGIAIELRGVRSFSAIWIGESIARRLMSLTNYGTAGTRRLKGDYCLKRVLRPRSVTSTRTLYSLL